MKSKTSTTLSCGGRLAAVLDCWGERSKACQYSVPAIVNGRIAPGVLSFARLALTLIGLVAATPVPGATAAIKSIEVKVGEVEKHAVKGVGAKSAEAKSAEAKNAEAKGANAKSEAVAAVQSRSEIFTLSDVVINRRGIFGAAHQSDDTVAVRYAYRFIDALHVTTREKTILREIGVAPGQQISEADVEELERNLRAMGLFASVSVRLIPVDNQRARLVINTRDRLSVVFGASGSFLGGIGELGFTGGERNVNGLGDRLLLSYSGTTDGQLRGAIAYDDIHFINRQHKASYSVGGTEEGRFFQFLVSRPFKTRASNLSWSAKVESIASERDYYDNGVSVAQIPERKDSVILDLYRRHRIGNFSGGNRYFRYGPVLRFDQNSYQPTEGLQPNLVTAPLDNNRIFAGALVALSRSGRYEKSTGIDSLGFTEDLSFGYSMELLAGVNEITEAGLSSETIPAVFLKASRSFGSALSTKRDSKKQNAAGQNAGKSRKNRRFGKTFGRVIFSGNTNLQSGGDRSWSAGSTLKLFNRSLDSHTFAARIGFVTSDNGTGLPSQYTLGENNGLRGYAARQFSGANRLRINLEDRIDTGWRVGVFDVGLLAFFDAGWAGDTMSQVSLRSSAGVGLRLGSNSLLGADIIRMDLAYPFDPVDGGTRLSLSLSLGQVFTF